METLNLFCQIHSNTYPVSQHVNEELGRQSSQQIMDE